MGRLLTLFPGLAADLQEVPITSTGLQRLRQGDRHCLLLGGRTEKSQALHGLAFQSAVLFNSLSVEDNVALTPRTHQARAVHYRIDGMDEFGRSWSGGLRQITPTGTVWRHALLPVRQFGSTRFPRLEQLASAMYLRLYPR